MRVALVLFEARPGTLDSDKTSWKDSTEVAWPFAPISIEMGWIRHPILQLGTGPDTSTCLLRPLSTPATAECERAISANLKEGLPYLAATEVGIVAKDTVFPQNWKKIRWTMGGGTLEK